MPEQRADWMTAECGCRFATDAVTETFIFEPCSLTCELYVYAVAAAERQGKPMTHIDLT